VVPSSTALDRTRKGAMPEVLPTACGSLTIGLDAKPGQIPLTNRKLAARASGHHARRLDSQFAHQRRAAIWTGTGVNKCWRNRRRVLDICVNVAAPPARSPAKPAAHVRLLNCDLQSVHSSVPRRTRSRNSPPSSTSMAEPYPK
jgi:hypothetical protein